MKALVARLRIPARWIAWSLVVTLGVGGYVLGIAPRQVELRATLTLAQTAYERAALNERVLARSAAIENARSRVRTDLAHLIGRADSSSTLEATLQLIAREAAEHQVLVHAIVRGSNPRKKHAIESVPITLDVIGRFVPISAFVRDLSRREVLVDVHTVRLEALSGSSEERPLVRGTIEVSIDRILDVKQEE